MYASDIVSVCRCLSGQVRDASGPAEPLASSSSHEIICWNIRCSMFGMLLTILKFTLKVLRHYIELLSVLLDESVIVKRLYGNGRNQLSERFLALPTAKPRTA